MNNEHERCSELLDQHVAGTLAPAERSWVDEHLASCIECRTELAAVQALQGLGSPDPLTELERARMRREVLERAVPLPAEPDASRAIAPPSGGRWYQVLGAAALVAVIGTFAYLGLGNPGGGDEDAGGDSTAATGGGESGGGGGSVDTLEMEQGAEAQDSAGAPAAGSAKAAPPEPAYRADMGSVDRARMNRLGRRGLSLVLFSRFYSAEDVPGLQSEFVDRLAARAPDARGQDIRDCAALVTSEFENSLPAFAGFGEYPDRGDILILGFAWTDGSSGPLDKSMVWAWSIDGCDVTPVHYSTNVIRPKG